MTSPRRARDLADFSIRRQPDDSTCGPTCLHAIYRHYGDEAELGELPAEVGELDGGGTLGVLLATHALRRGYRARISTWNLMVFDPTWFPPGEDGTGEEARTRLGERLLLRAAAVDDPKLAFTCRSYVDFLRAGGEIVLHDLSPALLRGYLERGLPILTGLSSTYLYREARELLDSNRPDDVHGSPCGHFVVLTGYVAEERQVLVSDPLHPNALAEEHTYPVPIERLIGAIYLGVLTYDANIIVIEPAGSAGKEH